MTIQWFRAQQREGMIGFLIAAIEDGAWRAPRDWEGESDAMLSHFCLMVYERMKRGVPVDSTPPPPQVLPHDQVPVVAADPEIDLLPGGINFREKTGSWW